MAFSADERAALLAVKGVGPTVLARLEQLGYGALGTLAQASALEVVSQAASLVGSSCWKNSPQARSAVQAAIARAKELTGSSD